MAILTVTLSNKSNFPISVDYTTSNDTALAGSDYTLKNGTLNFAAGDLTQTISIPITNDNIYEGSEAFKVLLSNVVGQATIANAQGIVTIMDDGTGSGGTDNDKPIITINDVTVNETSGMAVFTVTLSNPSTTDVTFNYATQDGTAVTTGTSAAGTLDYTSTAGSKTIAAGTLTTTIEVPITNDGVVESTEYFNMLLSNVSSNAIVGDISGKGTITSSSTNEDTSYILHRSDFGLDTGTITTSSVTITSTLPSTIGTLQLNGINVTQNQSISITDLDAGKLVFTPYTNSDVDASLDYILKDSSNNTLSSNTAVINVIAVADLPTSSLTVSTITTNNDSSTYIHNDVNIVSVPYTLATGTDPIQDQTFSETVDAKNGVQYYLSFDYLDNSTGSGKIEVYFGGQLVTTIDGDNTKTQTAGIEVFGGSGDGSNLLTFQQVGTGTAGVAVGNVFMAPVENMLEYNVNLSGALTDTDGSETLSITLSGLPTGASLDIGYAGTTTGTWIIPVTAAANAVQVYSNLKMYVPESADTFTLTATSRATETNDNANGLNFAEATSTASVVDVSLNAAPTSSNDSVSTNEDTTYIFTKNDFGTYTDANSDPFSAVMITSLPTNGTLHLLGHDAPVVNGISQDLVSVGTVVTLMDLNLGNLVFVPNANVSGIDTFDFRVSDGRSWSASSYVETVGINAVADMPSISLSVGTATSVAATPSSVTDDFSGTLSSTGWAGTGVSKTTSGTYANTMQILHGDTATKTFDLGIANAGKTVTITFTEYSVGGMESGSASNADYLVLTKKNTVTNSTTTIATYQDSAWNGTLENNRTLSYTATVDASGMLQLSLYADSSASGENFQIDNFIISGLSGGTSAYHIYPITITDALGVDKDGSEALGNVTLNGIPDTATLYANGIAVTVTGGSATLTQSQVTVGNITMQLPDTQSQTFTLNASVTSTDTNPANTSQTDTATATATASVTSVDHTPVLAGNVSSITLPMVAIHNTPVTQNTNIVIMLDTSGSMSTVTNGVTRLAAAKTAIDDMLNAYSALGNVEVKITTFSTTATAYDWMTVDQAKALINGLQANGYTNYEDALYKTYNNYTTPTNADAQTVGFFISDGEPTKENLEGRDVAGNVGLDAENGWIDTPYLTDWTNFVNTNLNQLDVVGIGSGITNTTYLDQVANGIATTANLNGITGGTTEVNTTILVDPTTLAAEIAPHVDDIHGNLNQYIDYGSDGIGSFVSITIDGTQYLASNSANVTSLQNGITTSHGGEIIFNFTTGDFTYQTNSAISADYQESFSIVTKDGNGTSSAPFSLNVDVYANAASQAYTSNPTMEGGVQVDVLTLSGANIDFSALTNISSIHNIEKIDLTGGGDQTLNNLKLSDVLNLTSSNTSHVLEITGDSGDQVNTIDKTGWTQTSSTSTTSATGFDQYVYQKDGTSDSVTLKVEHQIDHVGL